MPEEFKDIAPYGEENFHAALERLVREPGFEHAVKFCMPGIDYPAFVGRLLDVKTQAEFQHIIMGEFLEKLVAHTTAGLTFSGIENCRPGTSYTFISNHRDIVLDASFLNLCLIRAGRPLTQVAIGNNLLIYDWITDLVKLNRSFIVKRDVKMAKALEAAAQLSAYIHYAIGTLNESVWIAQREGRAKDSNDLTQESLVKMLSLAGGGSVKDNLLKVNLNPVAISYEYDPNDYLKAREFLLRQRDPQYKKTTRDDLFSMETGLLSHKGRVHFSIGPCINDALESSDLTGRTEVIRLTCGLIDRTIHRGYKIFPCNYIAYDFINHGDAFSEHYTEQDVKDFRHYLDTQLDKVAVPHITPEERELMRQYMLGMYSNPLRNLLLANQ